jgi:hypothetical protein
MESTVSSAEAARVSHSMATSQPHFSPDCFTRRNKRNLADLMPIITPAYPQQNAAHNVNLSTKFKMIREILRGECGEKKWHA